MANQRGVTPIDFRVYYADGSTYDGYHNAVENTPIFEVLLIVERNANHGRKLVKGGDYYIYYQNGTWHAVDFVGMLQYMRRPYMEKRFLVGVMSYDEDSWNDTVRKARSDPDFPPQTALSAYETRDGFD